MRFPLRMSGPTSASELAGSVPAVETRPHLIVALETRIACNGGPWRFRYKIGGGPDPESDIDTAAGDGVPDLSRQAECRARGAAPKMQHDGWAQARTLVHSGVALEARRETGVSLELRPFRR